jgi:hypothetical protein
MIYVPNILGKNTVNTRLYSENLIRKDDIIKLILNTEILIRQKNGLSFISC